MDSGGKQPWRDGITGVVQALVGAYLGAALYIRLTTLWDPGQKPLAAGETFTIAAVALLVFSWWIVPMGAAFGVFAKPVIRRWSAREASLRGVVLGALLGAASAWLAMKAPVPFMEGRHMGFSVDQFWFMVAYCGAWCGLYSWEVTRRRA